MQHEVRNASAVAAIGLLVLFGLLAIGGIRYEREERFLPDSASLGSLPRVYVGNTRALGWGNPGVVGVTHYGKPFEVFVSGSLPLNSPATSVSVDKLRIEADAQTVFLLDRTDLALEDTMLITASKQIEAKGFGFSSVARIATLPNKVRVTGHLILRSSAGSDAIPFERTFSLQSARKLSVGSWSWHF